MTTPYRLITIAPSHYCEKARWALQLAGVPFVEEPHPPVLHMRAAGKGRSSGHSTPVLVAEGKVIPDSTEILQFVQESPGASWRPYPADSTLRNEALELEELFDTHLGPHTRRLAYHHLLPHRALFLQSVLPGVGRGERIAFKVIAPVVVQLMRRGMNINPESAARSAGRVDEVFSTVAERLADGRRYLVGSEFSAADLTLASLAAPVVLPPTYGSPLPDPEEAPADFRAEVERYRSSCAGEFVLKMYRDHR
jgi:glutathione S-transferase